MPSRLAAIKIQRQQDALMRSFENNLRREVNASKMKYIKGIAQLYRTSRLFNDDRLFDKHVESMVDAYNKAAAKTIKGFGLFQLNNFKKSFYGYLVKNDDIEDSLYDEWISEWANTQVLARASFASKTTKRDLESALRQSLENGESPQDTIKRLNAVGTISKIRAEVIAATETHAAAMFASKLTFDFIQADIDKPLLKYWISTEDDRTRQAHIDMDPNEGIPLDDMFDVGGEEMDRPGDTNASAENTVNCRCVLAADAE